MQDFIIRHRDEINPNEYRVHELNGISYTAVAAKYTLKRNVATFWYWDKNILNNRYELISFLYDGIKSVSQIIDAVYLETI